MNEKIIGYTCFDVASLDTAFADIDKHLRFSRKTTALKATARQSVDALATQVRELSVEQEHLQCALQNAKEDLDEMAGGLQEARESVANLEAAKTAIAQKGNLARKQAVARANRYKARLEGLLGVLEAVLPGAKALLTGKGLLGEEKAGRTQKLETLIKDQKAAVRRHVSYQDERYRDTFLPGYGREKRLLEALIARKRRLAAQKSY